MKGGIFGTREGLADVLTWPWARTETRRHPGLALSAAIGLLARVFTLLLLASLATVGCGRGGRSGVTTPTGAPAKPRRVLAFGDSVTLGVTTSGDRTFVVSQPYPTVLGDLLRALLHPASSTLNAGVGGELTDAGASRFPSALASSGADVALILEGINDARSLHPLDLIVSNLRSMVRTAKANGVTPLIGTLPPEGLSATNPVGPEIEAVNDAIRAMAAQEGIGVVDFFRGMSVADMSDDGFHPSEAGYRVMANLAFQVITALP